MKFRGTTTDFHRLLLKTRMPGQTVALQHGLRFVAASGAGVNWWPNTGTLVIDGPQPAKDEMQASVVAAMQQLSAVELRRRIRAG
jgi:hypothetical protein